MECEEGDAAYAESVCAAEELKFYKDNVDPADMTSLKKPTTEHDPALKFKSADETKMVDVGTPILSHTDLACNTSYHFAASCTVFPWVSPYHGPGPFAPFGSRI